MFRLTISVLFVLCVTSAQNTSKYVVPKATVKALQPNGFRIYIPGNTKLI